MQKLFENFRIFLNEAGDPDSSDDNAPNPKEVAKALERSTIENAIQDASFNSAQSSQHRWSPRQPIVDYNFDDRLGVWTYMASIPDGTNNADNWPTINSKKGEDLDAFLARVKQPHQLNLALKKNEKLFENWRKYLIEVDTDDDGIDDEKELAIIDKGELEPEYDDNKKLYDVFWGSAVQAIQLAEMTGNTEMVQVFDEIMQMVKAYVSRLDGFISGEIPFDQVDPYLVADSIEEHAIEVVNQVADLYDVSLEGDPASDPGARGAPFDNWIDTLIEAGDYVWYHGTPGPHDAASEESSKSDYEELKRWAGI